MLHPRYWLMLVLCLYLTPDILSQQSASLGFRKVGSYPGYVRGEAKDIALFDHYACVAMGEGGLCIVDVSNRSTPTIVSRLDLPGDARRVKISGNVAYFSCASAGLQIVDLSNASAPMLIGSFDTPAITMSTAIAEPFAFLADGTNGVVILNIANPAQPTEIGALSLPDTAYDVAAELAITTNSQSQVVTTNRYLQIANGTNGFLAYFVANDASLNTPIHRVGSGWSVRALSRFGEDILYADRGYIGRVPYRSPVLDELVATLSDFGISSVTKLATFAPKPTDNGFAFGFNSSGGFSFLFPSGAFGGARSAWTGAAIPGDGYYYVVDKEKGLTIYQPGYASVGNAVGSVSLNGQTTKLRFGGNRLYLAEAARITALGTNSDGSVSELGSYSIPSLADFDVSGSTVFTAAGTAFPVINMTDPAQPTVITNLASLSQPFAADATATTIAVADDYAYFSVQGFACFIADVHNPGAPFLANKYPSTIASYRTFAFAGTNLFGATGGSFYWFSIQPNKALFQNRTVQTGYAIEHLFPSGTNLFVADRADGLRVYNISNPSAIPLLSNYRTGGDVWNVTISGNYAFLCDRSTGVLVLDITNPSSPNLVTTLPLSNPAYDVQVQGNRLFLAQGAEGVTVWDMVPRKAQTIDFAAIPAKTMLETPFTLSATASSGLSVNFSVASGPATVKNGQVTLTGPGTVTIRATQPGNDEFGAISQDRTFTVTRAQQQLAFPSLDNKTTRSAPFPLAITSSSGLPVTVTVTGADFVNGILTTTAAGTVTIHALQSGNSIWDPVDVQRTFAVAEAARDAQTIVFAGLRDLSLDDDPQTINISASSGLPVDVAVTGPATFESGVLTPTGLGEVHVTATQSGDRDNAPVAVERIISIRDLPGAVTADLLARNPKLSIADADPNADPDHDGLPNIVEYILGSDPTSATSQEGHITAAIVYSNGNAYLRASFKKPRSLRYPIAVQVGDFADYPGVNWISVPVGFDDEGNGVFLLSVARYRFPLIRLAVNYQP